MKIKSYCVIFDIYFLLSLSRVKKRVYCLNEDIAMLVSAGELVESVCSPTDHLLCARFICTTAAAKQTHTADRNVHALSCEKY